MQIVSFRVRKYRHIQDSGEVELNDNLTCIVGKNQSGKTAILRALHKFNPHEKEPYNIKREWPRGERREKNPKQIVCEVKFQLDENEKRELAKFTPEVMTTDIVVVTKDYGGNFEIDFPEQQDLFPDRLHPNDVDELCLKLPTPDESVGPQFRESADRCISEVFRLTREGRYTEFKSIQSQHRSALLLAKTPGNPQPQNQCEEQFINSYIEMLNQIYSKIENIPTMHRKAHEYIVGGIPTFIYMDDYREFQGTALLDQVKSRRKNPNHEDETFLVILKLAGLDLDDLIQKGNSNIQEDKHERQLDLEDGALSLTKDVAGRWGQNPYKVQFRVDGQTFFTEIEEEGKKIGMIPLEEQSKGFRWFFSFDLKFMHDSEGSFEGCVLLLDEPGLHLHPGGQEDLLRRLDKYAEKNTLIYTTHLPFLIDLREPSRIRVISQVNDSAVVTNDFSKSGIDEKLTLQAALGMKANQHYLVSPKNLVVEGVDDFWIITELSNLFERSEQLGLPDDVCITAAGGASEVVYMSTFMIGQDLEVVALFDSDKAGKTQEEKLRTKWLTLYKERKSATLLLGNAIGENREIAIEDIFSEEYYLSKVQESHKQKLKEKDMTTIELLPGGLLKDRVDKILQEKGIKFNKGSVAKLIRKDLAKKKKLGDLGECTLDKATKLLASIREAFNN